MTTSTNHLTLPRLLLAALAAAALAACATEEAPAPEQAARPAIDWAAVHAQAAAVHADRGAALFDQLDTDRDGRLSAAELAAATGIGAMVAFHQADIDADGDGFLTRAELATAIERHERERHAP